VNDIDAIAPLNPNQRYLVDVTSADRHVHVTDAWNALVAWNHQRKPDPPLYLYGGTFVRVSHDEDHVKLEPFTRSAMLELLSEACQFVKVKSDGSMATVAVPTYVADWLLSRSPDKLPQADRISRVTDVPVFGSDESLMLTNGYHDAARTYVALAPELEGLTVSLSADPTTRPYSEREMDVEAAVSVFDELLHDFPFADTASKAHAISLILEPFTREMIGAHPTPLTAVMAHQPGTGKGLLVDVCLGVSCGSLSPQAYTSDEDELRKRLTSVLMQGAPVVFFDNVKVKMDSGALAAALTAHRWSDRILGVTKMADVPIRNVWVCAANNPSVSEELTRRIVPIFLESPDIDPRLRTNFMHPNLTEWAREQRANLVSAAVVLVSHYLLGEETVDFEGAVVRERATAATFLASYTRWAKVMGGILAAAGIPGFLENLDQLHESVGMDHAERGSFIAALFERSQGAHTTEEWLTMIGGHTSDGSTPIEGLLNERISLPHELQDPRGAALTVHRLGVWFREQRGAISDGHRVLKTSDRPVRWQIERVG
jgi:hypothetical protein